MITYFTLFYRILEEEVSARECRRIVTAMKPASLPHAKTIEEFAFTFLPIPLAVRATYQPPR